jgi:hypothetical protein
VGDVSEDVEAGDEVVVDPLEDREVHHPGGLRELAHEAAQDGRVVEVPEHGQQGVRVPAVAVPDPVERGATPGRIDLVVELLAAVEIPALQEVELEPEVTRNHEAAVLGGEAQELRGLVEEARFDHREVPLGGEEGDPELVLDHVDGDLTAADRPADEGHHEVLRVVEEEGVAARGRDLVEAEEGVRGLVARVAGHAGRLPRARQEDLRRRRSFSAPSS